MSKKLITKLHSYVNEKKPNEEDLLKFIKELANSNDPADRTITSRFSKFKSHLKEIHPSYSDEFLKKIAPPRELTLSVIEANKIKRNDKRLVEFDQDIVNKLYSFKDDESPLKKMIFLQFVSGRRVAELFENELGTNPKNQPKTVKMKLDKKGDKKEKLFSFNLIQDAPITNKEWRKLLISTRKSLVGVDKGVYSQRINKIIKRDVRPDLSSHDLRSIYAVYRFQHENPDSQNLTGYIGKILNHSEASDSGIAYSNFKWVKK
jgi:hypothetical protein